jgi:hypothetical protein
METWEKNFLIWGWRDRGLNVSTLQIYLSELRELGRLARGLETMGQDLGKTLIRGMKNLATPGKTDYPKTEPLTITDLKNVRKGLEKLGQKLTGQSVWACCLVAFWGAFRLGELLGNDTVNFDKFSSLLWEDVKFKPDSVEFRIKSAKVRGPPGNSVLLFSIPDQSLCPVTALARLHRSVQNLGLATEENPVFRATGGKLLTKSVFLQIVNGARENKRFTITGKSFRTGLPSAMENFPNFFKDSHVKALGRWRGRSYQTYMKNDTPEFRWVFQQVASALLNQDFLQANQRDDPATWTETWSCPKGKFPRKRIPARGKKPTVSRRKKLEKQTRD